MNQRTKDILSSGFAILIVLLCMGAAGNDDYAEAVKHEKINCERNPKLEYCQEQQ
jgi:hypothetical protein